MQYEEFVDEAQEALHGALSDGKCSNVVEELPGEYAGWPGTGEEGPEGLV